MDADSVTVPHDEVAWSCFDDAGIAGENKQAGSKSILYGLSEPWGKRRRIVLFINDPEVELGADSGRRLIDIGDREPSVVCS
jgi:hypothetical protein